MDTFELLPSLAQGELAETSAPELVAAVFRSRASGTLWMETADSEIRCFFRAGDMCGTGRFKGFQTLAHVLLVNDWVAALDIESSAEEASGKGQRHGEVLVERGLLTPDQLRTALGAQHTANLTTLLCLPSGKYDWRGWEPPPAWAREVVVDPVSCVIDALELPQHAPRRRKVIDWLGRSAARLSHDWPELQGRVILSALDRRAAALLALPRKLEEFVQASRLPQTRAEALLCGLLLAGGAEPQPQASAPPPALRKEPPALVLKAPAPVRADPPRRAREPVPQPLETEHLESLQPEAELLEPLHPEPGHFQSEHLEPEHLEPILDPLPEREREAGPFDDALGEPALFPAPVRDVAPVDPFAEPQLLPPQSRDSIELEEELLPEAPAGPSRRSGPAPRREVVDENDALARLDSLLLDEEGVPLETGDHQPQEEPLEIDHRPRRGAAAGGSTASSGREEPTFDHALEPEGSGSDESQSRDLRKKMTARGLRNLGARAAEHEEQGSPMQEAPVPPAQLDESLLTAEELRFVDEVRSRARQATKQNAFARLGVSPGATNEQIKSAYLGLAKRFHPDRASGPGLEAMQPELQALFGQLKDSYDAISTAEQRARYDVAQKAAGSKPSSRKEEAILALKMGDVLFKKRDFEGAIHKLRRAVDLEATGDGLAALAWALVADPKGTPAAKEEAATLINRALRAPGVTARTYYVAGVLWRTKDPDSAVDAFRKALQLDPGHSDAALELRLIEQRRGKQAKTGGGVLSGLLFGKRKT